MLTLRTEKMVKALLGGHLLGQNSQESIMSTIKQHTYHELFPKTIVVLPPSSSLPVFLSHSHIHPLHLFFLFSELKSFYLEMFFHYVTCPISHEKQ